MEILLFILMSIRPYIQGQAIDLGNRPSGCNIRFECDTEAELPDGVDTIDGDTAYAEDTNKIFRRVLGEWVEKASFSAGTIPAGLIAMWSGTLANIPAGWALCDGQNGTPDLRDKFVKGAADGQNPGATGGALTHTHAAHSYTPAGSVTINALSGGTRKGGTSNPASIIENNNVPTGSFSGDAASLTHDSPNHEPPYFAVAYIMKT